MKKLTSLFFFLALTMVGYSQTVIFNETFETTPLSVTSSGTPGWARSHRFAKSSTYSDSSKVVSGGTSYLTTTNSFSTVGNAFVVLEFDQICKTDPLDSATVEISINGGTTWTKLVGSQYLGSGLFGTLGNKFCAGSYTIWALALPTQVPQNLWWQTETFDISSIAANQANVKFRFKLKDGGTPGGNGDYGWLIDNVKVKVATSELVPPVVTLQTPILQDTVYTTTPYEVKALITDASGIDTAYIVYKVNNGTPVTLGMTSLGSNIYQGFIPGQTYYKHVDYQVFAKDGSPAANIGSSTAQWFYVKKGPSIVQIGTGTSTQAYPFGEDNGFTRSASIYSSSEINSSGIVNGLQWYVASVSSASCPVKIYLKSIPSSTFSTTDTWANLIAGATLVYNGTTSFSTVGWQSFTPTAAFNYNSGNLMVLCEANYGASGTYLYATFNYSTTTGNTHQCYSQSYSPPITSGALNTSRPNIKISFPATNFNHDAGVKQIITPSGTIISGSNTPVTLLIKNYSVDTLVKATVAWKLDGVLQTPHLWTGSLLEAISSAPVTIGNINVTNGSHTIKAWTELPNDSIDQNHGNDTTSISFYACSAQLSGTYTIGGALANFPTFADVMIALNNCGISGPTVFKINSGTYNKLTFNAIIGASATNTITFKPNTGATVIITDSSSTSTLKLDEASYIIFDGSNNGTTTRNMTIMNTSTASSTAAVWIASEGTGCNNNVIKNCNIKAGDNASGIGIFIGGATIGSTGADNDNITIQNNNISKANVGILAQGSATSNPGLMDNLQIKGNILGSTIVNEYLGHDGIILSNGAGCNVEKNTIFNIITSSTTPVGLTLSTGIASTTVLKNNINNIIYTGTGGYGGRGLYVNTNNASTNLTIANNIIYKIGGDGYSVFSNSSPVGMYFDGTAAGLNIYYNSVYMSGDLTYSSATSTTAILFYTGTLTGINLKNNVFQNSMNNTANTTSKNYAIYSIAPSSSFTSINNNDYYTSGSQGVLGFLVSDKTTIAAWRTATAQDINSLSVDPGFLSTSDLHTYSSQLNAHGTPIAGITDDIEGNVRNATTPDIGAYEYTISPKNLGIIAILHPVNSCAATATENVTIRLKNYGSLAVDTAQVYYKINNGSVIHEQMIHTILPDSSYNYTFTQTANISAPSDYSFKAYIHVNGDITLGNDTINNYTINTGYDLNFAPYTMGFEATDDMSMWTKADANADGYGWTFPFSGTAHSGSYSAQLNNGYNTGNDWLFSRCFKLNAGTAYKIEFWYLSSSASSPQNIDLKVGNNNTPAAMTTSLLTLPSFINTTYQKASANFTPATTGSYNFGWWGHSASTYSYANIDDINISFIPLQEATMLAIDTPVSGCGLSNAEPVTIEIKNTGTGTINGNLTAYYKFNGLPTVSETVTSTILPNDTLNFTFSQTIDASAPTIDLIFPLEVWLTLTGDPYNFNDTLNSSIASLHVPIAPFTVSDTVTYGTPATLKAFSSDSVNWYNSTIGGTLLYSGHTFTTPNLFATTVYYAQAVTPGGCTSAWASDSAHVQLFPWETSIVSMPTPTDQCTNGSENITINIRNNGSNTINGGLTAKYTINGGSPVSEPVTATILPGNTLAFTFATPINAGLSSANLDSVFNIKAFVKLTGDNFPINDTVFKSVTLRYTPPAPVVANITIPYGTTGTIHATSNDSISWYNLATGGTLLSIHSTYTTPILYNTTVFYAQAKSPEINMSWTFDTGLNGWTPSSPCSSPVTWAWASDGGHGTAFAIDYSTYSTQLLTSPVITLNGAAGVNLSYNHRYGTEANYDHGLVAYRLDGGSWVQFMPSVGNYNTTDAQDGEYLWNSCNQSPYMPLYDGTMTYATHSGLINTSGATTLEIAFEFTTDGSGSVDGWYIDNVTLGSSGSACASIRVPDTIFVTGVPPCDMSVQAIYTPNSGIELTNHELVKVKVINYGTSPAIKVPIHYKINNGTVVNDTIQGPIAPHDTAQFTFTTPANLSAFATYNLTVYTNLACDATHINDTLHKTVVCSPLVYCTSASTYTYCNISNVTMANLNNGAPLPVYSNPSCINTYTDYTALSPALLIAGSTYPISVSECISSTYFYNSMVNVYLDYNRNGVFDLPQELIFSSNTSDVMPTVSGTFTVPTSGIVTNAPLRLRVVLDMSGGALPCGTYSYGETEDYTVNISPQIPHDAGVSAFVQPPASGNEGASIPVQVTVRNYGLDTITNASNMTVAYSYNGGTVQSIIWNGGNILPSASANATLPNISILPNAHSLCAWTVLAGDSNKINDTTCMIISGMPQHDAGITEIIQPSSQVIQGTNEIVKVVFRNFGIAPITSLNLAYKINGVLQSSLPWTGTLTGGATDTVTFTQTFVIPSASFNICAYTSYSTDANHANDTLCKSSYGVFTSTLPYYDNFDSPTVSWSEIDTNGTAWQHGTPAYGVTNSAHSAPFAWDLNLTTAYTNSARAYLYTQNFNFSSAVNAKMKFWANYNLENNYDGVRVDYSTDTSATWQTLGTVGDPNGFNWYTNATINSSGKPAWSSSSSGWKESAYKLSLLNNVPIVRFRFVFSSDSYGTYDGFSIDDFSIVVPAHKDAGVTQLVNITPILNGGDQLALQAKIMNYGLDTLHSIPVKYSINGGTPITETWMGTLLPDSSVTFTFTTTFNVPANDFSICSWTQLANDGNALNDTICTNPFGIPLFNVPYTDNFESLNNFYVSGLNNQWQHGVPSASIINTAHSPVNVWATNLSGNYSNSSNYNLNTPRFNFANMTNIQIGFWHWYETEASFDGGRLQYTLNNGVTWTTLGVVGDAAGTNWYTHSNINGSAAFSGSSAGWVYSSYTLPAMFNHYPVPVQFRFNFFANSSNNNNGWAIDDFKIIQIPLAQDGGVIAIVTPGATSVIGTSETVQVTIKNFGTAPLTTIPVRYTVNNGVPVQEQWTGNLAPGATTNYTFTAHVLQTASYTLCAYSRVVGDSYTNNDTTCISVQIIDAQYDAGITEITSPGAQTANNSQVTVTVKIKNFGTSPLTAVNLQYDVNAGTPVLGTYTGNIASGAEVSYTFTQTYPAPTSNYSFCAKTNLTNEQNTTNDKMCKTVGSVGIDDNDSNGFSLGQNMPNPASGNTIIPYSLPSEGTIRFEIVNILGQNVYAAEDHILAGKHIIEINADKLAEGVYYYTLIFNDHRLTRKLVVNK